MFARHHLGVGEMKELAQLSSRETEAQFRKYPNNNRICNHIARRSVLLAKTNRCRRRINFLQRETNSLNCFLFKDQVTGRNFPEDSKIHR